MMGHQPYCDHRHTPRQECNTARRIGAAAEWPPHDAPAELAAPSPTPLLEQPDVVPIGMREAIAASEVAPARGYVAQEWRETVAAVEAQHSAEPAQAPAPSAASPRRGRRSRRRAIGIALVLLAAGLAACFLHDADLTGDR
jgi:hypothetical protein